MRAHLALGSNLGDRLANLQGAEYVVMRTVMALTWVIFAVDYLVRLALVAVAAVVIALDGSEWIIYVLAILTSVAGRAFRPAQASLLPTNRKRAERPLRAAPDGRIEVSASSAKLL